MENIIPFIVKVNSRIDSIESFQTDYIEIDTEASLYVKEIKATKSGLPITFNKGFFNTSDQCTPLVRLREFKSMDNVIEDISEHHNTIGISVYKRSWRLADIQDYVKKSTEPILVPHRQDVIPYEPNINDTPNNFLFV
jgi:uncharacterized protein YuzE